MPSEMTRRTVAAAVAALVLGLALSGCSSEESKLYDIFRCGKAATLIGDAKSARTAGLKANAFAVQGSKGAMAMQLNERFTHQYGSGRSIDPDAVLDLYQSGTCRAIYEP